MAPTPPMSESSMAEKVVSWLEQDGWTIYQEVQPHVDGPRADIVAQREGALWVVEAKKQLSFDLLAQAEHWKGSAHCVWVAVPLAKSSNGRSMAFRVARLLGLGVLEVRSLWPIDEGRMRAVSTVVEPTERSGIDSTLLRALRPEHQTHAKAGTNRGDHFTRYRATCEAIARYVTEHPGCTLREALSNVDHHYASIASGINALRTWASKGKAHGIELREEDGVLRVYPAGAKEVA